jgi:hypothetical protein
MSKTPDTEPATYFEIEQRRLVNPDEEKASVGPKMPKLPSTSPWSRDPVPDEPTVDRREDGDTYEGDFA